MARSLPVDMCKRKAELPYRGPQIAELEKQIAELEKQIATLQEKLAKLKRTSRAFKTEAEHKRWVAQFM